MTTINNIVHAIAYNPPWREAVKANELGQERPDRLPELVHLTQEKTRPITELLERLGTAQTETNQRLNRKGGRLGNLEGNNYERRVRYRVMAQSPARFQLNSHTWP